MLPYHAQIMRIKCDPHSENQPSELFQVCMDGAYFHNLVLDHSPIRFDSKTLVACGVSATH